MDKLTEEIRTESPWDMMFQMILCCAGKIEDSFRRCWKFWRNALGCGGTDM